MRAQFADLRQAADLRRRARADLEARIQAAARADPDLTAAAVARRWRVQIKRAQALVRAARADHCSPV